jgi:hypothetical protein
MTLVQSHILSLSLALHFSSPMGRPRSTRPKRRLWKLLKRKATPIKRNSYPKWAPLLKPLMPRSEYVKLTPAQRIICRRFYYDFTAKGDPRPNPMWPKLLPRRKPGRETTTSGTFSSRVREWRPDADDKVIRMLKLRQTRAVAAATRHICRGFGRGRTRLNARAHITTLLPTLSRLSNARTARERFLFQRTPVLRSFMASTKRVLFLARPRHKGDDATEVFTPERAPDPTSDDAVVSSPRVAPSGRSNVALRCRVIGTRGAYHTAGTAVITT